MGRPCVIEDTPRQAAIEVIGEWASSMGRRLTRAHTTLVAVLKDGNFQHVGEAAAFLLRVGPERLFDIRGEANGEYGGFAGRWTGHLVYCGYADVCSVEKFSPIPS